MLSRFAMIISVKTLIIGFPKNIIAKEGAFSRALLVGITKYQNVGK